MAKFVKFPGTAGSYASTDDVNVLDADTAHTYQSRGTYSFGGVVDDTASWSGRMNSFDYPAGGTEFPGFNTPDDALTAATEYSVSVFIKSLDWSKVTSVQLHVQWEDSAGAPISTLNGPVVSSPTEDQRLTVSGVSPALTTEARVFQTLILNDAVTIRFSDNCIREGSDATFVPSLRIVGDLDLRAKLAATDWTSGATQIIVDNYDSSGYQFNISGTGLLGLVAFGTTGVISESSAALGGVDGVALEARVTLDVSAGTLDWYKDGSVFSVDTFAAQPLIGSDVGLFVGMSDSNTAPFAGDFYYCEVRDGIDGPVVAQFNAEDIFIP